MEIRILIIVCRYILVCAEVRARGSIVKGSHPQSVRPIGHTRT